MYPQQQYPPQPQYAPPAPQYPQQGYPQQAPVYQPAPAAAYPIAGAPSPYYPPAPYAHGEYASYPAQTAPPQAPPAPAGTLDDFFDQRSGGNPSWKFLNKPIGTSYWGVVARKVGHGDIEAVTDQNGKVSTFKDGRIKYQMKVPMLVQPTAEHQDGMATWYVKGQGREELARAMAEAGAPEGVPEVGATIRVTLINHRQVPNMSPQYIYRVEYQRPQGAPAAAPVSAPVAAPQPVAQPAPQLTNSMPDGYQAYPNQSMPQHAYVQQAPMPQQFPQQAPAQQAPAQQAPPQGYPQQGPPQGYPQQMPQQAPMPAQAPMPQQGQAPQFETQEQADLFARLTNGAPQG